VVTSANYLKRKDRNDRKDHLNDHISKLSQWILRPSALSAVSPGDGVMSQYCDALCDVLSDLSGLCGKTAMAAEDLEIAARSR
jgi:hypothetical protein